MRRKDDIRAALRSKKGQFYVYALYRPDGTPFYVGKGRDLRIFFHEREALGRGLSHKLNTIRRITTLGQELGYEIVGFHDTKEECDAQEIAEILRVGRRDLGTGPLTNLTAGGEGVSGLSEETKRRIDAELHGPDAPGERGIANRFFLELCKEVRSVPIRPLSRFRPQTPVPHRQPRRPTRRMAAALAASAILNEVRLEPGCLIPRKMQRNGVALAIENGAAADLLRAGIASLVAGRRKGEELFRLDERQCRQLIALTNRDLLLIFSAFPRSR